MRKQYSSKVFCANFSHQEVGAENAFRNFCSSDKFAGSGTEPPRIAGGRIPGGSTKAQPISRQLPDLEHSRGRLKLGYKMLKTWSEGSWKINFQTIAMDFYASIRFGRHKVTHLKLTNKTCLILWIKKP